MMGWYSRHWVSVWTDLVARVCYSLAIYQFGELLVGGWLLLQYREDCLEDPLVHPAYSAWLYHIPKGIDASRACLILEIHLQSREYVVGSDATIDNDPRPPSSLCGIGFAMRCEFGSRDLRCEEVGIQSSPSTFSSRGYP